MFETRAEDADSENSEFEWVLSIKPASSGFNHLQFAMTSKPSVSLFPWDAKCATHRAWLFKQRVECNWDHEKVEKEWREEQIKGTKCIYWIVGSMEF